MILDFVCSFYDVIHNNNIIGHTFERNDREGPFHCAWTDTHKDIGNVNERTKGET